MVAFGDTGALIPELLSTWYFTEHKCAGELLGVCRVGEVEGKEASML